MLEPRSSFVDADSVRLHYCAWDPIYPGDSISLLTEQHEMSLEDNDNIPVVLLHDFGATAQTWGLVAQHLSNEHPVLAFDLRGHGLSAQPENGYELTTLAEDIISAMATLGLGQIALVGHGLGARIALALAARHPALVSHLVLVDCPHLEPQHWPGMTREQFVREHAFSELYTSRNSYLQEWRNTLADHWSPDIETILMTYVCELPDGQVEERLHAEHQRQIRSSMWEDRALSYYPRLTCPVLLVPAAPQPGAGSIATRRQSATDEFSIAKGQMTNQIARVIQSCSILWMPETVHDIQLQRPRELAEAIANFLQV